MLVAEFAEEGGDCLVLELRAWKVVREAIPREGSRLFGELLCCTTNANDIGAYEIRLIS